MKKYRKFWLKRLKRKIEWMLPVSRRRFFIHQQKFSMMMKAVKEIEALNRRDVADVVAINGELVKEITNGNKIKTKKGKKDVMFN